MQRVPGQCYEAFADMELIDRYLTSRAHGEKKDPEEEFEKITRKERPPNPRGFTDVVSMERAYVERMHNLLAAYPSVGTPLQPSRLFGEVYLGSSANAENVGLLRKLGITYVLNCAGGQVLGFRRMKKIYGPDSGILGYEELAAEDSDYFDITRCFSRAHHFLDFAHRRGGKALVYCPGVSRSGAVTLSYMVRNGVPLLEATRVLKEARRCALCNQAFMAQLVTWARERNLLDVDLTMVTAPRYGRALDMYRIKTCHFGGYNVDIVSH